MSSPSGVASVITLPEPRLSLYSKLDSGLLYSGETVWAEKMVRFRFGDVSPELFDAQYDLRLQMGRWKATHTQTRYLLGGGAQRVKKGAGYYFPTANFVSGMDIPHDHGMLRGDHVNPNNVSRPNYWPVASLGRFGSLDIHIKDFAAPYFKTRKLVDSVNGISGMIYMSGKMRPINTSMRGVGSTHQNGRFVFRYMAWDAKNLTWVYGPISQQVTVAPFVSQYIPNQPYVLDNAGVTVPSSSATPMIDPARYGWEMRVNIAADGVLHLDAWFAKGRGDRR